MADDPDYYDLATGKPIEPWARDAMAALDAKKARAAASAHDGSGRGEDAARRLTVSSQEADVFQAIHDAMADERNGQPDGDIIVKGCEAAGYHDPESAADAFKAAAAQAVLALARPTPEQGDDRNSAPASRNDNTPAKTITGGVDRAETVAASEQGAREATTILEVEARTKRLMEQAAGREGLTISEWIAARMKTAADLALATPAVGPVSAHSVNGHLLAALKVARQQLIERGMAEDSGPMEVIDDALAHTTPEQGFDRNAPSASGNVYAPAKTIAGEPGGAKAVTDAKSAYPHLPGERCACDLPKGSDAEGEHHPFCLFKGELWSGATGGPVSLTQGRRPPEERVDTNGYVETVPASDDLRYVIRAIVAAAGDTHRGIEDATDAICAVVAGVRQGAAPTPTGRVGEGAGKGA